LTDLIIFGQEPGNLGSQWCMHFSIIRR